MTNRIEVKLNKILKTKKRRKFDSLCLRIPQTYDLNAAAEDECPLFKLAAALAPFGETAKISAALLDDESTDSIFDAIENHLICEIRRQAAAVEAAAESMLKLSALAKFFAAQIDDAARFHDKNEKEKSQ